MYLAFGHGECKFTYEGRKFMALKILLIALAGALGTLSRYGLAGLVQRFGGESFPWGTLAVNILGCFIVGFISAMFEERWPISAQNRTIVLIGFFGAFTTFSAFILNTGEFVRTTQWLYAFGNVLMQNGIGLAALFAGIAIARAI